MDGKWLIDSYLHTYLLTHSHTPDLEMLSHLKTAQFETLVKKGGWGHDFVQTKILFEIVTRWD